MGQEGFVKIASARTTLEAEQIVRALKEHKIVSCRQSGIMDIYMGNSMEEHDIMVAEKDVETAARILSDFKPVKSDAVPRGRLPKGQMILGWITLAVILLCIIVPLLFL